MLRATRRSGGFALLIVLWTTMLLGVVVAVMLTTTRTEALLARNLREAARARALAEGGIWLAVHYLAARSAGSGPASYGAAFAYEIGDARVWVAVEDEAGKIDLNTAPGELIRGLFRTLGADETRAAALTDAIIDWRDADWSRRPAGAEDAEYRRAGLAYLPRNGPFPQVDELRLVLGIDDAMFNRAAASLTVHSNRPRIDPWAAPRDVLLAVPGIKVEEVDAFLAARAQATQRSAAALPRLSGVSRYIERMPGDETFLIRAQAELAAGSRTTREAIVRLSPGNDPPYEVLLWRTAERPVAPR
jgi:general secretion pathway protein K